MHVCALQLRKGTVRELAPARGMFGPCEISGGAITKLQYHMFDRHADRIDPSAKTESWRAFLLVTARIYLDHDPEWEVEMRAKDGSVLAGVPNETHKAPGLELIRNLAVYFPLLPEVYTGAVFKPAESDQ